MKTTILFLIAALTALSAVPVLAVDYGPIACGQTTSGNITGPSVMNTWTFVGNAGDRVIINAVKT